MKKNLGLFASCIMFFGLTQTGHADVSGIWLTVDGKSQVEIANCDGDKFCGKIIWLKEPNDKNGSPKKDTNNRDDNKKDRPILGINLLQGLEKSGDNEWDDGSIYNPEDGETYSSEVKMINADTLEVKGCVLFICKEQIWDRVK
ncbi:MAG: DUF2147 domain-containing protein [Sneathiella sp.]